MERLEQRERELLKISFTNERKLTAEEELELEEIRCISMIHACLIYGTDFFNGYKNYAKEYAKTLGFRRLFVQLYILRYLKGGKLR